MTLSYLLPVVIHHIRSKYHYNSSQEKGSKVAGRVLKRIRATVDSSDKEKKEIINKLTTLFHVLYLTRAQASLAITLCSRRARPDDWGTSHGLYSSRSQKWRQNVQNSSETTSHRQVVSLQSFEHFDVIFMGIRTPDTKCCGIKGKSPVLPIIQWIIVLLNDVFIRRNVFILVFLYYQTKLMVYF